MKWPGVFLPVADLWALPPIFEKKKKIAEGRKAGRAKKNKNAPPPSSRSGSATVCIPPGWDAGYLPTLSLLVPLFSHECREVQYVSCPRTQHNVPVARAWTRLACTNCETTVPTIQVYPEVKSRLPCSLKAHFLLSVQLWMLISCVLAWL